MNKRYIALISIKIAKNLSINDRLVHSLIYFKSCRSESITASQIESRLGLSLNTVKTSLRRLESESLIKGDNRTGWEVDQLPDWIVRDAAGNICTTKVLIKSDSCPWNWTEAVVYWVLKSTDPDRHQYDKGMASLFNLSVPGFRKVFNRISQYVIRNGTKLYFKDTPDDWWQHKGTKKKAKKTHQPRPDTFDIRDHLDSQDEHAVRTINNTSAPILFKAGYSRDQAGKVFEALAQKYPDPNKLCEFLWGEFEGLFTSADQHHHQNPEARTKNSFFLLMNRIENLKGRAPEPITKVVEEPAAPEPETMMDFLAHIGKKLSCKPKLWTALQADYKQRGKVPVRSQWDTILAEHKDEFFPKRDRNPELIDELKRIVA